MDIKLLIIIEIYWLSTVINIFTKRKEKIMLITNDKLIIKMINERKGENGFKPYCTVCGSAGQFLRTISVPG